MGPAHPVSYTTTMCRCGDWVAAAGLSFCITAGCIVDDCSVHLRRVQVVGLLGCSPLQCLAMLHAPTGASAECGPRWR